MFVVGPADAEGPLPLLLTGYGGFNISQTPDFRSSRYLWLEAGGVVALPNLRGGGEFGEAWHQAGMRERKQSVFDDFIAAAEHLIATGRTTPAQLAIAGGSNGGLLVSAVTAQRPELFAAVYCTVPLTDMVRFHRFGIANIWTEEYGSPDDPQMFPHLYAYSPYHNLIPGAAYPAMLIVGSANDARTDPVHARKLAARVAHVDADGGRVRPILLEIQEDSGHGGAVQLDTLADQTSRHFAFLMDRVGLQPPCTDAPPSIGGRSPADG
jgi:prolyl oligopeptidase